MTGDVPTDKKSRHIYGPPIALKKKNFYDTLDSTKLLRTPAQARVESDEGGLDSLSYSAKGNN